MKACTGTRIEAVVSIDNKGQIVLPKDLRDRAGIKPGDKLVLITGCDEKDDVCCFIMLRADYLNEPLKGLIGPMLREVLK